MHYYPFILWAAAPIPDVIPEPVVATESAEQELRRLRRENRALQMRCEILKKTVAIFSDPSANAMR
ncbi:hypothetical protein M2447_002709 [Ereboglobus sp. PH5-10]|uniref:hypothetical protein n=1 Tax=Ereboglobus sp. PH5-10 TaxID=2940629 RepID=UPI0024061B71|nr:hypothetical protein [Ereboglobus sp. PH5-10]MDF9828583.1 hypothetical protein [Ereboglobus sp. PH5-10]